VSTKGGPTTPTPPSGGPSRFFFRRSADNCAGVTRLTRVAKKVLLAAPRRYCAGVDRAVEVVRRALAHFGSPIYVREQIVHNVHVVSELERECAVFVESERDVPYGETLIFSAHGVSPAVRAGAEGRELRVIDAACPLVTKVHSEAIRLARAGYRIALIGHAEQEEVEGALGEAPEATIPENCGTRARRPLLRHVQPPACGQGACATHITRARRRFREQLQLAAPR
jgi:4-hydroxy-3-methylbut-2-enyl diphosphate reductase